MLQIFIAKSCKRIRQPKQNINFDLLRLNQINSNYMTAISIVCQKKEEK